MMTSKGTKVNEPHSVIQESTGPITTDSLAAESTRAGGAFKENRNSEPQGVAGSNSTFTTTNTSGATRLDPASDAEARMAQNDWAEQKILSSGFSPSDSSGATGGAGTRNSRETDKSRSADDQSQGRSLGRVDRPKGANLHEGGFESDDLKNTSFTAEIGSEDDPGRAAENTFETRNAAAGLVSPTQKKISGDTPYSNLSNETSA